MKERNALLLGLFAVAVGALSFLVASQTAAGDDKPPDAEVDSDGGDGGDGTAADTIDTAEAQVAATISGWQTVGSAAQWLPALNTAEEIHGLPSNLLARMAYQESRFSEDIIRGNKASGVGALGILQLMPQFFSTVRVARPFKDIDVLNQIDQSGGQMASLYQQFGSWSLALAAYNAGAGNVKKYGGIPPFTETQNYVSQISADVPSLAVA